MTSGFEINIDGIIGPTHNYSGLSFGNRASVLNEKRVSNPKKAALQGLEKMRLMMHLGIKQAVFPPQERPLISVLKRLGYRGSNAEILQNVLKDNSELLFMCGSASSMWLANAATVSPSADSLDRRVHLTSANLINKFHRMIETPTTAEVLKEIFPAGDCFIHHEPLPPHPYFGDEGAANHNRFCADYGDPGVQLFVYGRSCDQGSRRSPLQFPARQTLEASKSIARLHQLSEEYVVFAQQSSEAIDAGVFHNDVISVSNKNVFFYHEKSFEAGDRVIEELEKKCSLRGIHNLQLVKVLESDISLEEAVNTYLFNSQLVSVGNKMILIAPIECQHSVIVSSYLNQLISDSKIPIEKVIFQDVRESMNNGGGPACLRLRVVLNDFEYSSMRQSVILTDDLDDHLVKWVEKFYRDRLFPEDLADPLLLEEGLNAIIELNMLLGLSQ